MSRPLVLLCLWLSACAAPATQPVPTPDPADMSLEAVVAAAVEDAAGRVGLPRSAVEVFRAEAVTWSDGSLGCPQPGMMYTQALVPGYRVRLRAGGQVLDYHASRSGLPTLCPPGRSQEPLPDSTR